MPKIPGIDYSANLVSTPYILNNDQMTPLTIFTLDSTAIKSAIVEYSIIRGSATEAGRIFIATDGSTLSFEEDKTNNSDTGVLLTGTLSGPNILVQYVSNNTGQTATFKYSSSTLN